MGGERNWEMAASSLVVAAACVAISAWAASIGFYVLATVAAISVLPLLLCAWIGFAWVPKSGRPCCTLRPMAPVRPIPGESPLDTLRHVLTEPDKRRIRELESLLSGSHPRVAESFRRGAKLVEMTVDLRDIGGGACEADPIMLPDVWALVDLLIDKIECLEGEARQ